MMDKFKEIISKLKEVQTELYFLDDKGSLGEIPDDLRALIEDLEQFTISSAYLRKVIRRRAK